LGLEISAVAAITPALLLVWYFHKRDIYPEPARTIWSTFALGVVCAVPAVLIGVPFYFLGRTVFALAPGLMGAIAAGAINGFLSAAMCEEACKLGVLRGYNFRRRDFNETMDGIVYGAVASLGFAAIENVLYSIQGGVAISVLRAFTAVPMHACVGAIMGYYVARARADNARRRSFIVRGYLAAVALHGMYDFPLLALRSYVESHGGDERLAGGLAVIAIVLALAVLISAVVWTIRLVAACRREQEYRRIIALYASVARPVMPTPDSGAVSLEGEGPMESPTRQSDFLIPICPSPPDAIRLSQRPRTFAAALTATGALLTCWGGAVTLAALVRMALGGSHGADWQRLTLHGSLLGLLPALLGLLFFSNGVRRLNTGSR
jgi:RsiW-degrading membrane proteinase PrsW (M82 family)